MFARSSAASLAALLLLGLAACQTENTTSPSAAAASDRGALAMRLPSEVVTATDPEADSIRVRIVPTAGPDRTPVVRSWLLRAGELLLPTLPAVRCSIEVVLLKPENGSVAQPAVWVTTYRWSSLIDILPGKTTQADVALSPVSGSLSLNVRIAGTLGNVVPPTASPAAGSYVGAQTITLTRPAGSAAGSIQYRIEDPTTGNASPWSTYTGPFSISGSSTLFYRTLSGTDTGLIATGSYTITTPVSPALTLSFSSTLTTPPGWVGYLVASQGSTATGSVVPGQVNGNAARIAHTLVSGTAPGNIPWVAAGFSVPVSNWPNLTSVALHLQADRPRPVTVVLLSSDPAYQAALNAGGGYGATLTVTTAASPFTVPRANFQLLPSGSVPTPPLPTILGKVTGIEVRYGCAAGPSVACNETGFVLVDEVRFLP